jgi:hypothetical protein
MRELMMQHTIAIEGEESAGLSIRHHIPNKMEYWQDCSAANPLRVGASRGAKS